MGVRGALSSPLPLSQHCWLKDRAPSFILPKSEVWDSGLPWAPSAHHGVLSSARGSLPTPWAGRGCPEWGHLVPGVAVLKGALQLLAWPQAESWPEPPPGS